MKKLSTYFTFIICLVFVFVNVKAQNVANELNEFDTLSSNIVPKIVVRDSSIYTKRLDSLNCEMRLVYNPHVQKYITVYTGSRKKEICNMLEHGNYYFPIFEKALKAYNVPLVFKFLPVIESAMDAQAVSKSGATGLWQFMYGTAKNYSLTINNYVDERKDPIHASYAAAKYLREAYNELGDWFLALAAYNCGSGAVKRAIIKAGGERDIWKLRPFLSTQTKNYIPAFIAAVYVMNYGNAHQILPSNLGVITQVDSIYVSSYLNLNKFCIGLNLPLKQLKHLNPSYIKGIIYGNKKNPKRLVLPQLNKLMYTSLYNQLYENLEPKPTQILAVTKPKPVVTFLAKADDNNHINEEQNQQRNIVSISQPQVYTSTVTKFESLNLIDKQQIMPTENAAGFQFPIYTNYTVKVGDTLLAIAQKFKGLTVDKIKDLNQLDGSMLTIGCILKLLEMGN